MRFGREAIEAGRVDRRAISGRRLGREAAGRGAFEAGRGAIEAGRVDGRAIGGRRLAESQQEEEQLRPEKEQ